MFKKRLQFLLPIAAILTAACGGGGGGEAAAPEPDPLTAPTLPPNPATVAGETITLAWSEVTDARSYNIYRGTQPGVVTTGAPALSVIAPVTTANLQGTPGERSYFKLAAVDADARIGTASAEFSVTPMARPGQPTATVDGANVMLGWQASAGAESYEIFTSSSAGVVVDGTPALTTTTSSAVLQGTLGQPLFAVVRARNIAGTSNSSEEFSATPIAAPNNFTATAAGESVNLTWQSSTGADSYEFFSSTSAGVSTDGTPTVTTTTTSASVPGSFGTTVFFVGRARNADGISTLTPEVSVTLVEPETPPAAPANLAVAIQGKTFQLTWSGSRSATRYNLYSSTSSNVQATAANLTQGGITGTSASVSGEFEETRFFVVTALNSIGESDRSNEATGTLPPAPPQAPSGLSVEVQGTKFKLSWQAVSDATSYRVYAANSAGVTVNSSNQAATNISQTSTTITGGIPGDKRYFVVTAVNNNGESSASNEASGTAEVEETFLVFIEDQGQDNKLVLVDPENPTNQIVIVDDFELDENFRGDNQQNKGPVGPLSGAAFKGVLNTGNGAIKGLHTAELYYRSNEEVHAIDLEIQRNSNGSAVAPTPRTLVALNKHITELRVYSDIGGSLEGIVAIQTDRGEFEEEWNWFVDDGTGSATLQTLPGRPKVDLTSSSGAFRGLIAHDEADDEALYQSEIGLADKRFTLPGGDISAGNTPLPLFVRDVEGTVYFFSGDRRHLLSYVPTFGSSLGTLTEVLDFAGDIGNSRCNLAVLGKRAFVILIPPSTNIAQILSSGKNRVASDLVPLYTDTDSTGSSFNSAVIPTSDRITFQYEISNGFFVTKSIRRNGTGLTDLNLNASLCEETLVANESLIYDDNEDNDASVVETDGSSPASITNGSWNVTSLTTNDTLAYGALPTPDGLLVGLGEDAQDGFFTYNASNPRVSTGTLGSLSLGTYLYFDDISPSYQDVTLGRVQDEDDIPDGVFLFDGTTFQLISDNKSAVIPIYLFNFVSPE